MDKIAIFPGSFDPITCGHKSIIRRAIPLFDKIIIAIGINALKSTYFNLETRKAMIRAVFADCEKVEIQSYTGLTIDFCSEVNARFLLRGLRTSADFEFERSIGQINKQLNPDIETVFLLTQPEHTAINSSIVRDILRHKGKVDQFVPVEVLQFLK
ncbi:MAG: pantetheine-phosphate adenylyltransferase [Bacteroidales bacterium]|nr:pantetheine-phosphate adenylyltransferase [Bacteroidales bacterium]